jgi:hypothetical protein
MVMGEQAPLSLGKWRRRKGEKAGWADAKKKRPGEKWAALKMPDGLGTGERRKEAWLEIRFLIFIFGLNQF